MKWERSNNFLSLDNIYNVFKQAIEIDRDLCFMTSFKHDNIIYIASPQNIDTYPDELLNNIGQKFSLWTLEADK